MPSFVRRIGAAVALVGGVFVAGACLPGAGPALDPYVDNVDAAPPTFLDDGSVAAQDVDLGDPFAIVGLNPSHGPFNGGTRTTITGRGFASNIVVSVGGATVPQQDVLASDPTHAAITTPPGAPGAADVVVVDPSTSAQRVLPAGFFYDAFAVEPASGATSGGTRVELTGSGTTWTAGATVAFDGMPCTAVDVVDATHIQCLTPADAPGTKAVIVTNADGTAIEAQDAYTYSDSTDGYRGGLSGGILAGTMRVLVLDDWTGQPIPGGTAIVGGDLATAVVGTADANGVVQLSSPTLTGAVTVTVAAKCHQPMTFVAVQVDTVTGAYINRRVYRFRERWAIRRRRGTTDRPTRGRFRGSSFGAAGRSSRARNGRTCRSLTVGDGAGRRPTSSSRPALRPTRSRSPIRRPRPPRRHPAPRDTTTKSLSGPGTRHSTR